MNFNNHSDIKDMHSFLSPSSNSWLNYTTDKLISVYNNQKLKEHGTLLHAFASIAIDNRLKQANQKKALNMFINDAIGFKMVSEQVLFYSSNAFGTADAIAFKDNLLRVFDLKTGFTKVSFRQLDVYFALFCLEYGIHPEKINMEGRIYQGNGYEVHIPESVYIRDIMNKIIEFDDIIEQVKNLG